MLSKKVVDALNIQINEELYSAYLYQAMAAYAASIGLNGFANWFDVQAEEERAHGRKIYDYIIQQGEKISLKALKEPPANFKAPKDIFASVLAHEKHITKCINKIMTLVKKEQDHATEIFLQWFVTEQIEEEANADEILQKIKLTENDKLSLFMIDKELASRVFTPIEAST